MKGFSTLRKNGFSRLAGSYPLQIQTGGPARSQSCILLNLCTIYPYIRYWNIYVPFYLCTYRNCWHIYVPFYLCKLYTIRIQDICTCTLHFCTNHPKLTKREAFGTFDLKSNVFSSIT